MKATIDDAGRMVIPKPLREALGLRSSTQLEVYERNGQIVIEPAQAEMRLEKRKGVYVAVPEEALPPLTTEMVRESLETVRR